MALIATKQIKNLTSGTYTPTLGATTSTNVAASTAFACQWSRVGNVVTVSGRCNIDPTTASIGTVLSITLPVASDLAASEQCQGTAAMSAVAGGYSGTISADAANNVANLSFTCGTDVANHSWSFIFSYQVL